MEYRRALELVLGFADFERPSALRVRYRDFNLQRVRALLTEVGDPDRAFPAVHIAGTKGKGSTAAMVAAALRAAGYRVGLYTSPHLHTIRERIAIDGEPVSEEAFARGVALLAPAVERVNASGELGSVTTFELLTALAFVTFRAARVEAAVVEVGLGGRLDATNVIAPVAVGITSLSLDHTDVLGTTLDQIAAEKAAIIKGGAPVACAPQPPEALAVVEAAARGAGAPLTLVGRDVTWEPGRADLAGQDVTVRTPGREYRLRLPLLGAHQRENAAVAVALCEALAARGMPVPAPAVCAGLATVSWPARLEVLATEPLTVADGAHNACSMRRLREAVEELLPGRRAIVIFGASANKDVGAMLEVLRGLPATLIAARSRHPRALPSTEVAATAAGAGLPALDGGDTRSAMELARALAGPDDLVLATGSLFVAAEAREVALGLVPEYTEMPARLG